LTTFFPLSKEAETEIWNDVASSFIDYELKTKTLFQLRLSHFPKYKVQQNLDRYMKNGKSK